LLSLHYVFATRLLIINFIRKINQLAVKCSIFNLRGMKTNIKVLAVLILLGLLTSSCYTYVLFEKPAPPEIIPDKSLNSIAFINSYDYTIPDSISRGDNNVFQAGVTEVINGLKTSFTSNDQINFNIIDTLVRGNAFTKLPDSLSVDSVKNICTMNNSSMLLVLEAFNMDMDWEQEVEEDEDGKSRTNIYYLYMWTGLSLYSESGDVIDRTIESCRVQYTSRPALIPIIGIPPSINKAEKEIRKLAQFAAENYVNKFYPGTTTISRKIYITKNLLDADNYCMEHNWDKAIELLKPLAASSDPKIARKAANNLSVAYEAVGNEQAAEYWFNKSNEGVK
jgi:hypothetical protein